MTEKPTACVYEIYNRVTGESYVGSTVNKPFARWNEHVNSLTRGTHNTLLQEAWHRSKISDWDFRVLEDQIVPSQRHYRESDWASNRKSVLNGQPPGKHQTKMQTVLEMRKAGATLRTIQSRVGMSLGWVQKVTRRYEIE